MQPVSAALPVWTEQLRICSYDVDFTRRLTSAGLCRYFLEAAWNHAEALGFGYGHLASRGRFWVLSRLVVEVKEYPAWGSAMRLRTWPRGTKSLFAMRDFGLEDEKGNRVAAGSSAWLVLDAASKRPQRLSKVLPELAYLEAQAALGRDPEKVEGCEDAEEVFAVEVRYTDMDVNRHVNSGRYIEWMLDGYGTEFHRENRLRVLEVNYLGETVAGEVVKARKGQTGPMVYWHSLVNGAGSEVCRARMEWERRDEARDESVSE